MKKNVAIETLTDKQGEALVPYFSVDREMHRLEKFNKRLFIILIIVLVMLFATNGAWVIYENQFEDISVTQENEDGYNNYIGNDGDIYNGESKADNKNPQKESGR